MLRILVVVLACLCATATLAAGRVALVIGNAAYANATPLKNPVNDATAIAATLEAIGFTVIVGTDLDKVGMEKKLREYAAALRGAEVALFYYSGHGLQVNGLNYLAPIDAALEDETSLAFEMINADQVFGLMGGSDRLALAFLDACRDNPLSRTLKRTMGTTRSTAVGNGLAAPNTVGTGLFITFSTAPNNVALDGTGEYSPFTEAVLEHIATPGLELNQVMTRVKASVTTATNGDQRPWVNSDLTTEVYLVPGKTPASPDPVEVLQPDDAHWQVIATSEVPAVFEEFIRRYPRSAHREEAEARLASLSAPLAVPVAGRDCEGKDEYSSGVIDFAICIDPRTWSRGSVAGIQEYSFADSTGTNWLYVIPETDVYPSAAYKSGILGFLMQSNGQRIEDLDVRNERSERVGGRDWDVMEFTAAVGTTSAEVLNYRLSESGFGSVQLVFVTLDGFSRRDQAEVQRVLDTVSFESSAGGPQVAATPDERRWRQLQNSQDVTALREFVRAFPSSPRRAEAEQRIASLDPNVLTPSNCNPGDTLKSRVIGFSFCLDQDQWSATELFGIQEFGYLNADQTLAFAVVPETTVCPPASCRDGTMANIAAGNPQHTIIDERVETINGRDWEVVEFTSLLNGQDMTFYWYRISEPGIGGLQLNFGTYSDFASATYPTVRQIMETVSFP